MEIHISKRMRWTIILSVLGWALAAYMLIPLGWKYYYHRHPKFTGGPRITETSDGHPGDPVNVALLGEEDVLVRAMTAAGWHPADPITFRTSVRIAVDSVIRKPDADAPVSDLFLFGRKQDLAFELPVGNSPRQRHHVRFWRWEKLEEGRAVWFGSASFDVRVGLSHTTGQITHHIGPDLDAERDLIMKGVAQAGFSQDAFYVDGFHPLHEGRNGGGDPWTTDGRLGVVALQAKGQ